MEGAAADNENPGDIWSVLVGDDPTSLISFGNTAEPLALEKDIGDALVNEGAEAPKPYLPPVEVRMLTSAAGGLLLAETASTLLRSIFYPQPLPWSFCEKSKKRDGNNNNNTTNRRTNFDQFAPPFYWKVFEIKLKHVCMYVCMYVCIFIKLHITAQSGPVIRVILCHSH